MKLEYKLNSIIFSLTLLFAYTGFSKLLSLKQFQYELSEIQILRPFAPILVICLPILELIIVMGLVLPIPRIKHYTLLLSFLLMSIFTAYVAWILFSIPIGHRPCSCGGVIGALSWKNHLYFNIFFMLLSFFGLTLNQKIIKSNERTILPF